MRHSATLMCSIIYVVMFTSLLLGSSQFWTIGAKASETVTSVEPQNNSATVGETFNINITIANVQDLYGVEAILVWNASVLGAVSSDVRIGKVDGVLHSPIFPAEDSIQSGRYTVSATSTNPAPSFNGSGNIARLTFRVMNLGDTELDLETQLFDYPPPDREPRISLPIAHSAIDGFFSAVIPEFSDAIVFFAFMIFMFFAVAFSKRFRRKAF